MASLTMYIQKDPPGEGKDANWLPAPDGPFMMILRLYWPEQAVLNAAWECAGRCLRGISAATSRESVGLCGGDDVFIVVPEADDGLREIVLVTHDAEAGGVEQQELSGDWFEAEPARGKHAEKVAAGEDEHVALDGALARADFRHDAIGPSGDVARRLSAGAAVAEEEPVGPLGVNLLRPQPLVLAVVPLDEVGIDDGRGAEAGQFAGLPGPPERTGEHVRRTSDRRVACQAAAHFLHRLG